MSDSDNGNDLKLPKSLMWFMRGMAGVAALALPWAGWVTVQLATITVRLEQQSTQGDRDVIQTQSRLLNMEERVRNLEIQLARIGRGP